MDPVPFDYYGFCRILNEHIDAQKDSPNVQFAWEQAKSATEMFKKVSVFYSKICDRPSNLSYVGLFRKQNDSYHSMASSGNLSAGTSEIKRLLFDFKMDYNSVFLNGNKFELWKKNISHRGSCAATGEVIIRYPLTDESYLIGIFDESSTTSMVREIILSYAKFMDYGISKDWSRLVRSLCDGSPAIKRAAIVGADGSVWARTEGGSEFRATQQELKRLINMFDNIERATSTGADLEEVHYIVPRTEPNLIFGKKEKSGFFAAKTKNAVLIAVYEGENQVSAEVRTSVKKMAEYLNGVGY